MTILVGAELPGLLSALEQALGGSQQLAIVRDAATIAAQIRSPAQRITALALSDTIAPLPGRDVATSLWEIAAYLGRYREPAIPLVLTLTRETPADVQAALREAARRTGGDLQLVSSRARTPDHPEARQAVAWVVGQLKLEPQRRQFLLASASSAGGVGKTTTVMHMCLQLARLGLRVLAVDLDIAQGGLTTFFRVGEGAYEPYTTLPDEHPQLGASYPPELVERRILHHPCGLDLLLSGSGIRDQLDIAAEHLEGLIDTLTTLDYDVVCFDTSGDWKRRPVIVSLLARPTMWPFVICAPGAKERAGARAALDVLAQIRRADGRTALDAAMLACIAGERGQAADIRAVRQELLRSYPTITDLGTLPRDPALLSMAAERSAFSSALDLAPRRPYCQALRAMARRWVEVADVPPAWLTRPDPEERAPRRPLWGGWSRRSLRSADAAEPGGAAPWKGVAQ